MVAFWFVFVLTRGFVTYTKTIRGRIMFHLFGAISPVTACFVHVFAPGEVAGCLPRVTCYKGLAEKYKMCPRPKQNVSYCPNGTSVEISNELSLLIEEELSNLKPGQWGVWLKGFDLVFFQNRQAEEMYWFFLGVFRQYPNRQFPAVFKYI